MDAPNEDPIRTIVCATDFSETAAHALRHAVALGKRHGSRLVLAHLVEPLPADPYPMPMALSQDGETIRKLAFDQLTSVAEGMAESGLRIDTRLDMGSPGAQLVEIASQEDADLIVVGTRGLTGFKHLVFGSTAEHVVRRARCPVLTVHPDDPEPTDTLSEVVVPTDLSKDAEAAVDAFHELFSGGAMPRVVLAFVDATPPYLEAVQHERLEQWHQPDARREDLEGRLAPLVERLKGHGFEVELRILDGDAVDGITSLAAERGSDWIVMSTHGHSAIVNALMGRTAQRIVQHAPCPVLSVRPGRHH